MKPTALNLQAIVAAIDQHAENCGAPLLEILLSPHEHQRLDWMEIRGVPINPDPKMGSGRFRLVCSGKHNEGEQAGARAEAPRVGELLEAA